jgi:hypothetical protein
MHTSRGNSTVFLSGDLDTVEVVYIRFVVQVL